MKFIHSSFLFTLSAIVQNTIFTFALDGKELEKLFKKKNLFVTIMKEKILAYFITLL